MKPQHFILTTLITFGLLLPAIGGCSQDDSDATTASPGQDSTPEIPAAATGQTAAVPAAGQPETTESPAMNQPAESTAASTALSGEPVNLALAGNGGHIVLFSSQYNASSWAVKNIIDGSSNKEWSANSGQPQSIVIGFQDGKPARIVDIVINPYSRESKKNWAKEVEIQVSEFSPIIGYRSVGTMMLNNAASDQVHSFDAPVTARFVKLNFLSNHGGSYMQASEIMVMGELLPVATASQPDLVNLASSENGGQLLKVSSEYNKSSWAAANLIDGDKSKAWSSNSANPQEVVVQLPGDSARRVHAVAINPYSRESTKNWIKDVEVFVSPKYSYKGFTLAGQMELKPTGDFQTLQFPAPIDARYVRLHFKTNRGGSYMQASEVAILGQ